MPLNWCDILMLFISCINDWLKIWPTNIMLQRLFEYQFITAVTSPNVAYTLFSFEIERSQNIGLMTKILCLIIIHFNI